MIYAYVTLNVTNPTALAKYREGAKEALSKHGGSVVSSSKEARALEGTPKLPEIAVLLGFPDADAATRWIEDPALSDVHAQRRASGSSAIILLV